MKYIRKTFSITDESVIKKLDSVDNQSLYIQTLILKDILNEGGLNEYKAGMARVADMIQEVIDTIIVESYKPR